MYFKIKRNTKLSKLQGAYASKVGKDVNSIRCVRSLLSLAGRRTTRGGRVCTLKSSTRSYMRWFALTARTWWNALHSSCSYSQSLCCRFLYDGNRINDDDTPASLDMEDNGAYVSTTAERTSLTLLRRYDRCDDRT